MRASSSGGKQLLLSFLDRLPNMQAGDLLGCLEKYSDPQCDWHFFHPFVGGHSNEQAAMQFWSPLKAAFPDYEIRPALVLAGQYEEEQHVSMLGLLLGNHVESWLGIPPTNRIASLRFALNAILRKGRIVRAYVMFDLIDLMRQSGFYPLRQMPGSAEQWPFAPGNAGFSGTEQDSTLSAQTLAIIREMQIGLPAAGKVIDKASAAAHHSPHWAENMNWFGPAGIGSSRGMQGFRDYHGALFLKAFPDRHGIRREFDGPAHRPGHFCEIGEGRLAMTAGWPAMRGTHTGGQWLGLPPTGAVIDMRVADWYRMSCDNKIVDNWVLIDLPHILHQMGLDVLDDLRFFVEPRTSRLD